MASTQEPPDPGLLSPAGPRGAGGLAPPNSRFRCLPLAVAPLTIRGPEADVEPQRLAALRAPRGNQVLSIVGTRKVQVAWAAMQRIEEQVKACDLQQRTPGRR